MKKIFALLVAIAMMLTGVALAAEVDMTIDRTKHLDDWTGKWVLSGAYVGEDVVEEWGLDIEPGMVETKAGAITLEIASLMDASANDKNLGTIVDQGNYWHAHVADMEGTMTFADEIGAEGVYEVSSSWDEFAYTVRGEMDGDFNFGPCKTHVKGDNETLFWDEITGVVMEDPEEMKYFAVTTSGHLVLCYAEKNLTKEKNNTIGFGYIFERAE